MMSKFVCRGRICKRQNAPQSKAVRFLVVFFCRNFFVSMCSCVFAAVYVVGAGNIETLALLFFT